MEHSEIAERLRKFAKDRDWEQFHSPKNLAMALAVEASELLEHFQWLTEPQSQALDDKTRLAVGEEIADVQIYLIRLADILNIDLEKEVTAKLLVNAEKYPAEKSYGNALKYTQFEETEK